MRDEREIELQKRFEAITASLTVVHGPDKAFAAVVSAWLMAIEQLAYYSHIHARDKKSTPEELRDELEKWLKSLHGEICEYMDLDQGEILRIAESFHQVVRDICSQKG